jgi:colanic acid biosynthesis glycosyl transferase WcaI
VPNVLILSLVFPPDSVSTAEIMGDLAQDLRALGHSVTVVTTVPHYNPDREAARRQPVTPVWGPLLGRSSYHGITVYHAAMPAKDASVPKRLAAWAGFHLLSTVAALTIVPRYDVMLVPSPPLSIGVSAWLAGLGRRAPFIYNVQEIYPDIAINLGAVKNGTLIGLLKALERFVYRRSASVTVIASRMRERLLERGVPPDKVTVIPNFVDLDRLSPVGRDNDFSRTHGLQNAFAVTYAGNMGPAQGLDIMVDAARLLPPGHPARFVLIGDGILRERFERAAAESQGRVQVLPYQPSSLMPQIYGASDVCLVPQAAATGSDAIPSKVYRIMASARPLIAVTDPTSDLAALVRAARCGEVVKPGDAAALSAIVQRAAAEPEQWRVMGECGRQHVAEYYARQVVVRQYDRLIRRLAGVTGE